MEQKPIRIKLTSDEIQFLIRAYVRGYDLTEIADELYISYGSARRYMHMLGITRSHKGTEIPVYDGSNPTLWARRMYRRGYLCKNIARGLRDGGEKVTVGMVKARILGATRKAPKLEDYKETEQ